MSYYPTNEYQLYSDAKSTAVDAKEISAQYPTLNDVPDYKKREDYLVFISSNDTYYRWDDVAQNWVVAINPGGGGIVDSIIAGDNIVLGGTPDDVVVGVDLNPTFTQVKSTAVAPVNISDLTRKDYVDTGITAVKDLDKLLLDGFSCNFATTQTNALGALYTAIAGRIGIVSGGVLDIGEFSLGRIKRYNITSYLQTITSGLLYVYAHSNPVSGNTSANNIKLNKYLITGIAFGPSTNGQIEYFVNNIDVTHTYSNSERLIIKIIDQPLTSSNAIDITTNTTNFTNKLSNTDVDVQKALDTLDDYQEQVQTCSDVDTTGLTNGSILIYDGAISKFRTLKMCGEYDLTSNVLFNAPLEADVNDNTSYGAIGTPGVGVSVVAGVIGNGRQLNGAFNGQIIYPHLPQLNFDITDSWSVCFWAKLETTIGLRSIIGQCTSTTGWNFGHSGTNYYEFNLRSLNNANILSCRWAFVPEDGDYHFYTITKQGGISPDTIRFYRDGVETLTKTNITQTLTLSDTSESANTTTFRIGERHDGGGVITAQLDIISIFDIALSTSELGSLYNEGVGKQNDFMVKGIIQHSHQIQDINGLQNVLDTKIENVVNVGAGTGTIFRDKTGTTANIKTLVQGANITLTNNTDSITIASAGGGEVNTVSNVGAGTGIFKQKTGVNLELKSLTATSNKITLANNTDDVGINVNEANIPIANLQNFLTYYPSPYIQLSNNTYGYNQRVYSFDGAGMIEKATNIGLSTTFTMVGHQMVLVQAQMRFTSTSGQFPAGAQANNPIFFNLPFQCWRDTPATNPVGVTNLGQRFGVGVFGGIQGTSTNIRGLVYSNQEAVKFNYFFLISDYNAPGGGVQPINGSLMNGINTLDVQFGFTYKAALPLTLL